MISEKNLSFDSKTEQESKIVIKRPSQASSEQKQNPFYDVEIFGQAPSTDDIIIPDSDEALSFPIAAHEIGHLVEKGKKDIKLLGDFGAIRVEELRAWKQGWAYLEKYLPEYFYGHPEMILKIQRAHERIEKLWMQAVDLMKTYHLEEIPNSLREEEQDKIIKERRKKLFSEKGGEITQIFEEIKKKKIGVKPDWDKLTAVVKKAVKDIVRDNKEIK